MIEIFFHLLARNSYFDFRADLSKILAGYHEIQEQAKRGIAMKINFLKLNQTQMQDF